MGSALKHADVVSASIEQSLHPVVASLGPSATLAINERSNTLLAQGREVFKFGLGQSPFPVPESVVQALRDNAHQKDYLPIQGLPALRQAVARQVSQSERVSFDGDDVIIGPGTKELMYILQLVFTGETLLTSPSWVSYLPQALICRRHTTYLSSDFSRRWRLSPEQLDVYCRRENRPRLLFLNYPGNPDGLSYTEEELKAIAEVARKHRLLILSDEIYGLLHHRGNHVSIARFYPEGTLISTGLSKWCGAGGWRLGALLMPPELKWLLRGMQTVASETFSSVSAPTQYAAVRAYEMGEDINAYLENARAVLRAVGMHCVSALRRVGGMVHDPEGAFYLLFDLSRHASAFRKRGLKTSMAVAERLLQDVGVALLPGSCFGRPPEELTFRMAYVNFDGAHALQVAQQEGRDLLDNFVEEHCPRVHEGMARMTQWIADTGLSTCEGTVANDDRP